MRHDTMNRPEFAIGKRPLTPWEAYCWLFDHAAYADDGPFQRGQIAKSQNDLATAWRWPKTNVRRYLALLQRGGLLHICQNGTASGTANGTPLNVITLCEYNRIPLQNKEGGTASGTQPGAGDEPSPYMVESKKEKKEGRRKIGKRDHPAADPRPSAQGSLLETNVVALPHSDEQLAFEAYKVVAGELHLSIPRPLRPGTQAAIDRRNNLRDCLREAGGLEGWMVALEKLREAKWITSGGYPAFSIDDMIKPAKFDKLMHDGYSKVFGQKEKTAWEQGWDQVGDFIGQSQFFQDKR